MGLSFQRRTFTSPLSVSEAQRAISSLVVQKNTLFFFFNDTRRGSVHTQEFIFRRRGFAIFEPAIQGYVMAENPTTIELRLIMPLLKICFYSLFPLIILPVIFYPDEMTINGITRVPLLSERIEFSIIAIGGPALIFFFNVILPLKRLEYRLIKALRLERNHEAAS